MASISSSTSSTSSTSSLGNTALRGFGGMVSGIDRDSIIEQMTLKTQTKIANQQKKITKTGWKQEAYQGLSDKIIDWSDKYASYTSSNCLKDANMFAKKVITVKGLDESTRFVSATGTSEFLDNVSITGVKQLATASVRQSRAYIGALGTNVDATKLNSDMLSSNLVGRQLTFEKYDSEGKVTESISFPFANSYKDKDGKTVNIDFTWEEGKTYTYTNEDGIEVTGTGAERLVSQLNQFRKIAVGDDSSGKLAESFKFVSNADGSIGIESTGKNEAGIDANTFNGYYISTSSSALGALGYNNSNNPKKIGISEFNTGTNGHKLEDSAITKTKTSDYLAGKKLTFNFNGSQKEIELITQSEAAALKNEADPDKALETVRDNLQKRLNQAYGTGAVEAKIGDDGKLSFSTKDSTSSISISSGDNVLLSNLGLEFGASSKVNLDGKLGQAALHGASSPMESDISKYVKNGELDLVINGVAIKGLNANSSISDILSKINSTEEAGVKATYVDATGQFMLVSSETGAGREINLNSKLANDLFGGNETVSGQNAIIEVSYGNGVKVDLNRASNTFDLEGLSVTVSGVFGGEWENVADMDDTKFNTLSEADQAKYHKTTDEDGNTIYQKWKTDSAGAVSFSAKADVDGVTEKVKEFFEEYNALVKEVNGYVTTRPDSSYEPLTDEQKAEMDEESIKNWEAKAKEGILYGDSTLQGLNNALQGVFTKLMNNGASYDDLKKIGITYSEDWGDGGVLVFDEDTFRSAMESDPELVSNIFTGGGDVKKGLIDTIDDTFAPYATRYASKNAVNGSDGSYGMLVEMAGTTKKSSTLVNNQIYRELKTMNEELERLKELLSTEEARYISQFTTMESLINQYNTQSSYLSQITG